MVSAPISYSISTEVPASYYGKLFDFMYTQYLIPQKQRFTNLSKATTQTSDRILIRHARRQGRLIIKVEISGTTAINAVITPLESEVSDAAVEEAKQDIVIATEMFEEKARKATWYFAWREGEDIVPEKVRLHEKSFRRLFLETQILFFVVFIVLGMGLFIVVYTLYPKWFWVVPISLILVQFVFVLFSDKIIGRSSDWTITKITPLYTSWNITCLSALWNARRSQANTCRTTSSSEERSLQ